MFEKRVPNYDHFGSVEVGRAKWMLILEDLSALQERLLRGVAGPVDLPYGGTLRIDDVFEANRGVTHQRVPFPRPQCEMATANGVQLF